MQLILFLPLYSLMVAVVVPAVNSGGTPKSRSTNTKIDFANFSYPWSTGWEESDTPDSDWKWLEDRPQQTVQLQDSWHRFQDSEGNSLGYLNLRSVTYGDLDGDGHEEVAVDLLRGSGGTANWHYLYVYKFAGYKPHLIDWLKSGSRAYGGLVQVVIQDGALVLYFSDPDRRVGDCCSDGIIRARYRLKRGRFVEIPPRSKEDAK